MANSQVTKITQLPSAMTVNPSDILEIVQNGINKKVTISALGTGAGTSGYSGFSGASAASSIGASQIAYAISANVIGGSAKITTDGNTLNLNGTPSDTVPLLTIQPVGNDKSIQTFLSDTLAAIVFNTQPYHANHIGMGLPGGSQGNDLVFSASSDGATFNEIMRLVNANLTLLMSGKVITVASTISHAGLNLPHGVDPTSPTNGDLWSTTAGIFARINGATVGPLGAGFSGYSGFSGSNGITGTSGYSGFSGTNGATGVSGFSGYSGVNGAASVTINNQQIAFGVGTNSITGSDSLKFSGNNLVATTTILACQSTTSIASINMAQGFAPTSPNNGDMWVTADGFAVHTSNLGTLVFDSHIVRNDQTNSFAHITNFPQANSSTASINIAPGSIPSSPTDGDIWLTVDGLFAQTQNLGVLKLDGHIARNDITNTFTHITNFAQANSSTASINIAPGSTPTSPTNGDIWLTVDGLFAQTQNLGTLKLDGHIVRNDQINTFGNLTVFSAGTTSNASINLPHGLTPSGPINGDIWTTGTGAYVQINGATVGPLISAASAIGGGSGFTSGVIPYATGSNALTSYSGFNFVNGGNVTLNVQNGSSISLNVGSNVNYITFYGDPTPLHAASCGLGIPGLGNTNDFIISTYDSGTGWHDRCHFRNSDGLMTLNGSLNIVNGIANIGVSSGNQVLTLNAGISSAVIIDFNVNSISYWQNYVFNAGPWTVYDSIHTRDVLTVGHGDTTNAVFTISAKTATQASNSTQAGLNIAPGVAPSSPINGDVWATSAGMYVRVNGSTVGPLIDSNSIGSVITGSIANQQLAVANGTNSIVGSSALTYDGTTFTCTAAASMSGITTNGIVVTGNIDLSGGSLIGGVSNSTEPTLALDLQAFTSASSIVTNLINARFQPPQKGPSATVTRATTIVALTDSTQASNSAAIFIKNSNNTPTYTGNWSIYSDTTLPSHFGGEINTVASSTASAGLNIPHGAAPTSPVDGDIWTTSAGLFVRINGVTIGPLS